MGACLAAAEQRGGGGLDRDDMDRGLLLLEIAGGAADGAARAGARDEGIDLPVQIRPDLGAGRAVVRVGVGGVFKLPGDEAAGQLRRQLLGPGDGARHAVFAGGEHQLGAVGREQGAPLGAHGVGHGENDAVAAGDADGGEPDAGVAARRLDDDSARLQQAALLGIVQHGAGDAVLYAARGVKIFDLGQQVCLQAARCGEALQLHERRVADKLGNAGIDFHKTGSFRIPT